MAASAVIERSYLRPLPGIGPGICRLYDELPLVIPYHGENAMGDI